LNNKAAERTNFDTTQRMFGFLRAFVKIVNALNLNYCNYSFGLGPQMLSLTAECWLAL
jgi:hypothetical protein